MVHGRRPAGIVNVDSRDADDVALGAELRTVRIEAADRQRLWVRIRRQELQMARAGDVELVEQSVGSRASARKNDPRGYGDSDGRYEGAYSVERGRRPRVRRAR